MRSFRRLLGRRVVELSGGRVKEGLSGGPAYSEQQLGPCTSFRRQHVNACASNLFAGILHINWNSHQLAANQRCTSKRTLARPGAAQHMCDDGMCRAAMGKAARKVGIRYGTKVSFPQNRGQRLRKPYMAKPTLTFA